MEILLETKEWLIAIKPPHLISEHTENADGFADLLAAENGGYIGVIHRLDRGVGGVMLYAKTPAAAASLSVAAQEHRLGKEYWAIAEGIPPSSEGELSDLLFYDRSKNKVFPPFCIKYSSKSPQCPQG
jgi:23S rRNA pseudouridine1911/1915/1917 synthase